MKPNELTEKEMKKMQKKFPQIKKIIPKKKLTKEEIQYRQVKRKARCDNICIFLITMFFLIMTIASIYMFYLMWNYKW